jgi:uncharacterized membrane protein
MYVAWKAVHIFGVVLFMGNIIVTALWKARADRSADLATVAFAQRTVAAADRMFTLPGAILIAVGGYAMASVGHLPLHGPRWIEWGQGLFYASAVIWLAVLIPAQHRLVALSEAGRRAGSLDPAFHRLSRRWATWGGIATLLVLVALVLMVTKP